MTLTITPNDKAINEFYHGIATCLESGHRHEGAVAPYFANVLRHYCGQCHRLLIEQYSFKGHGHHSLRADGAMVDDPFQLVYGLWEAKDTQDDLLTEAKAKFASGYPQDNILFQSPHEIALWQLGQLVGQATIYPDTKAHRQTLVEYLTAFFAYRPPAYERWQQAVESFREKVPQIALGLLDLIRREQKSNGAFKAAFNTFANHLREVINPNISQAAIEEMLIQHLLTERMFRKVFSNPDFTRRNSIAKEIEKVIDTLTARYFSRDTFLQPLDHFYLAIEEAAAATRISRERHDFVNSVYQNFFQGYSVKSADTHGIVYTPQTVVEFMVEAVADLLQQEFNRTLASSDVAIIDPFVGTGNFICYILNKIQQTQPSALPYKYREEIWANEVLLLPYYLAAMNIEYTYYDLTKQYEPFSGLCLVDTFELMPKKQLPLWFNEENTAKIERQQKVKFKVIIGNPPYNVGQVNENDNNKNRAYPDLEERIKETYITASTATNKMALFDAYVKALRWASDRIGEEGIIAFITNNSFLDGIAFDGVRKCLGQEFTRIYHLNLKGNARTSGERRRQEGGNIFEDRIRVSVGITFLVKKRDQVGPAEIYLYAVEDYWNSIQKGEFLKEKRPLNQISWQRVTPDKRQIWLTAGLRPEFETFLPMGTKEGKATKGETENVIFQLYGLGVATSRDTWAYNFNYDTLMTNMQRTIEAYNEQVFKWSRLPKDKQTYVDNFVAYDDTKLNWSESLKANLQRGRFAEFTATKIRVSLYRPFIKSLLYFDRIFNERVYQFPHIYPTVETEQENLVICLSAVGSNKPFHCLMVKVIPNAHLTGDSQCFPFYIYNEAGTERRENITAGTLQQFRERYGTPGLTKWDIFYYIYALLHAPSYREKYAANLRRELPRIPFVANLANFEQLVKIGRRLAELHVDYEQQAEYPLERLENRAVPINWRVEKMHLSADKRDLIYNEFLTLRGIPALAFEYRLGNHSALEWLIEQYRLKVDSRSGIVNDPHRLDDEQYLVRLIGQVIAVSVETMQLVKELG